MSWLPPDDETTGYDGYDESAIRVRPNPKANRPRTKRRPEHRDASVGRIIGVDRGRYTVLVAADTADERTVIAARARELNRTSIVSGDRVDLVGDVSGNPGSLARIVAIRERTSLLRRSADDSDRVERVIVANADQMLIVVAAANPEPRVRLVDRYLVAAYDAGLTPLLCVTKTDLADPAAFLAHFDHLGITTFTSSTNHVPLQEITEALVGHETVFVGHSGVGKSTLINALVPEAQRVTGEVNAVTGRGRHTSSSTVSFRMRTPIGNGWVIDTPGVRSFGLGHVSADRVLRGFADLGEVLDTCPKGCAHTVDTPGCALDDAVQRGELGPHGADRVESLRRLLRE